MKHLQSLMAVALCVILSLAFVGCSDDDDEPDGSDLAKVVIGTWEQDGDNDILTVKADGTVVWYGSPSDYQNGEVAASFNWKYSDGWVTLSEDGEEFEKLWATSVSQNKIVWQRYEMDDDDKPLNPNDYDGHDAYGYYDIWTWERYTK